MAQWASQQCGRAYTFFAAIIIIIVWAMSGPAFHYDDYHVPHGVPDPTRKTATRQRFS
jgi:hypothetical protein